MALDEALMETVAASRTPALRLYAWEPACLSIGYAQPAGQVDAAALEQRGWELVRRPTGGRAILHTDELTYAVIGPSNGALFGGGILPSYRRLSRALIASLQVLGLDPQIHPNPMLHDRGDEENPEQSSPGSGGDPGSDPVCFQVPGVYEITVKGKKLVGSAQVRRGEVVLQHGSLPLGGDIARICQALRYANGTQRAQAIERLQARATTVEELLGSPIAWEEAAEAFQRGFARALGAQLEVVDPTSKELVRAAELARSRYRSAAWIGRI